MTMWGVGVVGVSVDDYGVGVSEGIVGVCVSVVGVGLGAGVGVVGISTIIIGVGIRVGISVSVGCWISANSTLFWSAELDVIVVANLF